MPSTSGRAATYPKRADKLKFFHELKDLRDRLRADKGLPPAVEEYKEKVEVNGSEDSKL